MIDLLNFSTVLVKYVKFSAHYELRVFGLVKVLVGEPSGRFRVNKGPRGRKSSTLIFSFFFKKIFWYKNASNLTETLCKRKLMPRDAFLAHIKGGEGNFRVEVEI